MITKKHFFSFIFGMFLFACSGTNKDMTDTLELNEHGQEDFYAFIEKFNKDKDFQLSRIHFPYYAEFMDYDETDDNYFMNSSSVAKSDHEGIDFGDIQAKPAQDQEYFIKVEILPTERAAFIIYEGNENGIYMQFEFFNEDGKWFFKGYSDSSM
jgi:hypothetical protein